MLLLYICLFPCRPSSRYRIEFVEDKERERNLDGLPTWHHPAPFPARLISNDRVTAADHFQDVRLIRLDITGSDIRFVEMLITVFTLKYWDLYDTLKRPISENSKTFKSLSNTNQKNDQSVIEILMPD